MADIELVIKISEEIYKSIKKGMRYRDDMAEIGEAVENGTPLPKGHKRLIEDNFDVGPVFDEEGHRTGYKYVTQEDLNNAPTIIEADREG